MKIVTIIGARPQFIKAALLSRQIRHYHYEVVIHTGQHYDVELSDVFFKELGIPEPEYNLGIGSNSHAPQTARMIVGVESILVKENPSMVLVYGDTNSTLAGALAAAKLQIPIGHIEAGPRVFDKTIPEEVNRVMTDHLSTLLFAPTHQAVDNLKAEGIIEGVYMTGDVMADSLYWFSQDGVRESVILKELSLSNKEYLLVTVHRARNTDISQNMKGIIDALTGTNERVVFPIHPRALKCLKQHGLDGQLRDARNVTVTNPVGYLDMLALVKGAKKVLTDSGGLQKEAYIMGVPCITLDKASGWVETVKDGWNTLVYSDTTKIIDAINHFEPRGDRQNIFGDGNASERIVRAINEYESIYVSA